MNSNHALVAYLARIGFVFDILLNVVACGQLETISSRVGKALVAGRHGLLCAAIAGCLNVFWPDHCLHNRMEVFEVRKIS